MLRRNLAVRVASAVFRIASEMCRFPAYFDNPDDDNNNNNKVLLNPISIFMLFKNPGCLKARKCRGINTSTINLPISVIKTGKVKRVQVKNNKKNFHTE